LATLYIQSIAAILAKFVKSACAANIVVQ